MKHWAYDFIGQPWTPSRNCWWLVQEVFRLRYGVEMPVACVGAPTLFQAATVSGWRRGELPPQDGDIIVMEGPRGRHVGVMIEVDGRLLLLHNDGHWTPGGAVGSVVAQPLKDATAGGYGKFAAWRKS